MRWHQRIRPMLDDTRTDSDKRHLQRLIDLTDQEIDRLDNELWDLIAEESAIVEGEVG